MPGFTFDFKHYVPILKTKGGELSALDDLSTEDRARLTPLLELHPGMIDNPIVGASPKRVPMPVAQMAKRVCAAISKTKTARRPFFLDTVWYDGKTGGGDPSAVASLFQEARSVGLQAIPVVRSGYTGQMLQQIGKEIATDRRGCLFRVRPLEFYTARPPLDALLVKVGLKKSDVHFLLDYTSSTMKLVDDVPLIPDIAQWRTFSAASGSFPETLSTYAELTWHNIQRDDWKTWKAGVATSLPRLPSFADYACRFPGKPPTGGLAGVNLRYAVKDKWLVQTGGLVSAGNSPNMIKIFGQLVSHPLFCKSQHCAGDAQYSSRVPPNQRPGNAKQWVHWSVNHHLVFVVRDLAQHAWP